MLKHLLVHPVSVSLIAFLCTLSVGAMLGVATTSDGSEPTGGPAAIQGVSEGQVVHQVVTVSATPNVGSATRTSTEEYWVAIDSGGYASTAHLTVTDDMGSVVQESHFDGATLYFYETTSVGGQDQLVISAPKIWSPFTTKTHEDVAAATQRGATVRGSLAVVGDVQLIEETTDGDGWQRHDVSEISTEFAIQTGSRTVVDLGSGESVVVFDLETTLFEVLDANQIPAGVLAWTPPQAASLIDYRDLD